MVSADQYGVNDRSGSVQMARIPCHEGVPAGHPVTHRSLLAMAYRLAILSARWNGLVTTR
jgi:hypothetical protein